MSQPEERLQRPTEVFEAFALYVKEPTHLGILANYYKQEKINLSELTYLQLLLLGVDLCLFDPESIKDFSALESSKVERVYDYLNLLSMDEYALKIKHMMYMSGEDLTTLLESLNVNLSFGAILGEVGSKICSNADMMRSVVDHFGRRLKEEDVAGALIQIARKKASEENDPFAVWNGEVFCRVLNQHDMNSFPSKFFMTRWSNGKGQLSFLYYTVQASDLMNFSNYALRKVITFEEVTLISGNSKNLLNVMYHQTWNCVDLMEVLIGYFDSNLEKEAIGILEIGVKQCPELICLGLSHLNPAWNSKPHELIVKLSCGFLIGQQNSSIVLSRLWHLNSNLVIHCMSELHKRDPTCLSRLLDVAQEIRGLTVILEARPFSFAIDMAALASRREHLNLEKWLIDTLKTLKEVFMKACLDFVYVKLALQLRRAEGQQVPPFIPLSVEVVNIFLGVFKSNMNLMNAEAKNVYQDVLGMMGQESESGNAEPIYQTEAQFPADRENEANMYFEKVYSKEISVKQMIDILAQLKVSRLQREQEIFACMIHNLFDEYRFFPKYPEKELALTAVLFGSLIQYQLISYIPLGVALRYVLESLRKPVGSKMFKFGFQALIQFQSRLGEWPQYCSHLMSIPHLQQVFPDLVTYIQQLVSNPMPVLPRQVKDPGVIFSCVKMKQIEKDFGPRNEKIPEESVQDRLLFILNNISVNNLVEKADEANKEMKEDVIGWFANYLIEKRVCKELNYHGVYNNLIKRLNNKELERFIFLETFSNIYLLLNSEETVSSIDKRQILKNLAGWLGSLTLGENKKVMKQWMINEGYESNRLIVAIPFVCKFLEQSVGSMVFKPNNPWIMRLLRLLVEMYHFADLKLNLKFEVEVLCNKIQVDLAMLQNIILLAMEFALREVIGPVVERSSSIAVLTCKEIILKDFCMEGSEERMMKACNQMIMSVSGQLANVTAKDPLKNAIISNVRNFIQIAEIGIGMTESSIIGIIEDNLQILTSFIEKACVEKALVEMKENVSAALMLRRKHKERSNQPFTDPSFVNMQSFYSLIPEALKCKVGGLNSNQLNIYDLFKRNSLNSIPLININPIEPGEYERIQNLLKNLQKNENNSNEKTVLSTQQCLERFIMIISKVEKIVLISPNQSLSTFPTQHELRTLLRQILVIVLHAYNRDEVALVFSQKVVQILYKSDSPLLREISVILLDKLCEISSKVAKEVTSWIIYADDERKYNVPVTIALLLSGLLNVVEYDMQMAKVMETGRISAIEFCVKLIRRCVLDEPAIASPFDFVFSIETLNRIAQRTKGPESLTRLLHDITRKLNTGREEEGNDIRNRIAVVFNDWLRLFQYPSTLEDNLAPFVVQLQQQGIIKDDQVTFLFFRVCTELCIEYYLKNRSNPMSVSYQAVEAFSRLIVLMLKYGFENNENGNNKRIQLLSKVLSIISLVLVQALDRRNFLVQKPFCRLFLSLMNNMINECKGSEGTSDGISEGRVRENKGSESKGENKGEKNMETTDAANTSTTAPSNATALPTSEAFRFRVLECFATLLHLIRPTVVPEFVFAWYEMITHPKFVLLESRSTWPLFHSLLLDALEFLYPFLKKPDLKESIRVIYRDFLCEYYFDICNLIPSTCIQLRNLVLSAFPRNMKLPDPFTKDLKMNSLDESKLLPKIFFNQKNEFQNFPKEISNHLGKLQNILESKFKEKELKEKEFKEKELKDFITDYFKNDNSFASIHALVLSAGIIGINLNHTQNLSSSSSMVFFNTLCSELDSANLHSVLDSIANQMRFPNIHTNHFSSIILNLFQSAKSESIKEHITRVLLERLIVNRPHPWGLLVTFIELVKNPIYSFWSHSFTHVAPDIERLFDSVAKSCMISLDKE
ncbi:CCR4-Not complex, Not1 subunit of unknown function DUF3819 domain-containing protein [Rozella allomycis CSF55]|uniref:Uncharacterized protein n=1 Tax=Rozella allomycis (strain CSF55) TaxID=988480 RepID=A0A075AVZ7_ROZAC|nr:CCR4-Not complex, Not1 subunit of unknown function DUF3819 domain-containing protein [Rozella allomycis CSF55]|eukprot:EPZ34325.1 CCR4-Not complex, Not1 subunit of unknown function DUF3819 domain-containing protein [Rozella allomycis CSF55]